jgi:hypothetical protein
MRLLGVVQWWIIDWLHKLPEGIKFSNVFLLLLQQLAAGVVEELKQASAFCLDNCPLHQIASVITLFFFYSVLLQIC